MNLDALIFDIDGTLADTDPLHFIAWVAESKRHGFELTRETYRTRMSGRLNSEIIRDFFPQLNDEDVHAFDENKEARYREDSLELEPIAGLRRVLEHAHTRKLALAAVTNGSQVNALHNISVLGLSETFQHVITPSDVERGKPDPEGYLLALKKLGVSADKALVFEDSPSGIAAAQAAGLQVVGLSTGLSSDELYELGVSLVIPDYTAPELWEKLND